MNITTLTAVAVVTAALTVPAFAQYHHHRHHLRTASYHGPAYDVGTFRGAYNRLPVGDPFYDPFSRVGGMDPDMNPSGN
jgi:hypothetical protein